MRDTEGREIDYIRISLTDRCNLRCQYCMPEEGVAMMDHKDIMRHEEIIRFVAAAAKLGIRKVRLTGGEPLLRKNMTFLIGAIKATPGIEEVALTTNGVRLNEMLDDLIDAGLDRLNVSLDSLRGEVFKEITRFDHFDGVWQGIVRAMEAGIKVKLNVVVLKGVNDGEILDFVKLTQAYPMDVRFIELMPIGCGAQFEGMSNNQVLDHISQAGYRLQEVERVTGNGPAVHYRLEGAKGNIGFISPISHAFCKSCNRVRLTAEGFLKSCLHANTGLSIRDLMRSGVDDQGLEEALARAIQMKPVEHRFDQVTGADKDRPSDKDAEKDIENCRDTRIMSQIGG